MPAKRQRLKEMKFDLRTLELTSPAARGARMAPKPVAKVRFVAGASGSGTKGAARSAADPLPAKSGKGAKNQDGGVRQGDLF